MRICAMLLAVISVQAQAADQFDLICTGTKEWRGAREIERSNLPITFKLRVDVASRQFCYDRCDTLYSINAVAPKALFLGGFDETEQDNRTEMVDRGTGVYLFI